MADLVTHPFVPPTSEELAQAEGAPPNEAPHPFQAPASLDLSAPPAFPNPYVALAKQDVTNADTAAAATPPPGPGISYADSHPDPMAALPPQRVVGGGYANHPLLGDFKLHLANLANAQAAAGEAAGNVATTKAGAEAAIGDAMKAQAADAEHDFHNDKQAFTSRIAELAQMQRDASSAGIDPGRFERAQTPGQRLMFGIAAALSGASAGFNHQTGNAALEQRERDVDRDISAQQGAIDQKHQLASDFRDQINLAAQERLRNEATAGNVGGLSTGAVAKTGEANTELAQGDVARANAAVDAASTGVTGTLQQKGLMERIPASIVGPDRAKIATEINSAFQSGKYATFEDAERGVLAANGYGNGAGIALHEKGQTSQQKKEVVEANEGLNALDQLSATDATLPSRIDRLLNSVGRDDGYFGAMARGLRGADATRTNALLDKVAAATLPENERGNPKSVATQRRSMFGSESPEELKNGFEIGRRALGVRVANPGGPDEPVTAATPQ